MKMIKYRQRSDYLYECLEDYGYHSPRYNKDVLIKKGTISDGATGAFDISSSAWWVHDQLCVDAKWFDGSPCTPRQAANVLGDILRAEGRWFRAITWPVITYIFGCTNTHNNEK